jgi:hypothetical protein
VNSIYDVVRRQRDDCRSKTITVIEGYDFSQYETTQTIELYHNGKFLSGNTLSRTREALLQHVQILRERGRPRDRRRALCLTRDLHGRLRRGTLISQTK